jgi:glucose/arabinose dehydrogenase
MVMPNRTTPGGQMTIALSLLLVAVACESSSAPRNDAPTVQITEPAGMLAVPESTAVIFKGDATDPEDGTLSGASLEWTSSLDGPLGTGDSMRISDLSVGNHVVAFTATDSKGLAASATVPVTVTPFVPGNQPPQVTITGPAPGTSVIEGTAVPLTGSAIDPEDGALTGAALAWSSSLDGALGSGSPLIVATLSVGQHTITLRATDNAGAHTDASVTLTITAAAALTLGFDTIATGLSQPVFLTAAQGDPTRLFVVEKPGRIRVIRNGSLLPTPFLDIVDSVTTGEEQGLLGMAFAPDYAASGRFYVSYTSPNGILAGGTSVIARYLVSSSNPDVANPATGQTILTVDQPRNNHNGGMLAFGQDGYLYFGLGDGGSSGDPQGNGQDRTELLGSMLRIDVSGNGTYTIPPSNPYFGSTSFRQELWNYGLRNPWRWSFDRQTGDLYIGDVGQGLYEEIDVQPAASAGGENYGWNIMEGAHCYPPPGGGCDQTGLTLPVLEYDHNQGCAVVGGYVYRGSAIPELRGHYFYSDNCTSFMRSFRWTGSGITESRSWPSLETSVSVSSFGEDNAGELYVVDLGGRIYKVIAR